MMIAIISSTGAIIFIVLSCSFYLQFLRAAAQSETTALAL